MKKAVFSLVMLAVGFQASASELYSFLGEKLTRYADDHDLSDTVLLVPVPSSRGAKDNFESVHLSSGRNSTPYGLVWMAAVKKQGVWTTTARKPLTSDNTRVFLGMGSGNRWYNYVLLSELKLELEDILKMTSPEEIVKDAEVQALIRLLVIDEVRKQEYKYPAYVDQVGGEEDFAKLRKNNRDFQRYSFHGIEGIRRMTPYQDVVEEDILLWLAPGVLFKIAPARDPQRK